MSQTFEDNCFQPARAAQTDMASVENNFAALKSCFSGTSAPSNLVAGMWWHDTTNDLLKHYDGSAWQTVWDFGNECIPPDAIPADYVTSSMLNSTSGSEAVTTDVIRDAAITAAKLASTALDKTWTLKSSPNTTGSVTISWGDGQYMVEAQNPTGGPVVYYGLMVNGSYIAILENPVNGVSLGTLVAGSGTITGSASIRIDRIWKWE